MRIFWSSNSPWSNSGYGQQTRTFCHRLAALGNPFAILAFYGLQGGPLEWEGIPIYPSGMDVWGNDVLSAFALHHFCGDRNAGWIITLQDVWTLTSPTLREMHVASWCPVDHDPVPPAVLAYFKRTGAVPIAMSRFGQRMLEDQGLKPFYVPHGVETEVFKPHEDKARIRKALGLPEDAFVVGMVAANIGDAPPRKAFPEVFQAFARFKEKRPSAVMYLHTIRNRTRQGCDLDFIARSCGIADKDIVYIDQMAYALGEVPPKEMAAIYSAMDVLVNPSYGEGFGLPIVESQACGVPVIVADNTSMPELVGPGWLVPTEPFWDERQKSYYGRVVVSELAAAMEKSYHVSDRIRREARAFALNYDADVVTETYWKPVLAELEGLLKVPKVTPVDPEKIETLA